MSDMPVWITVNGVDEEIPEGCMDCVTTGILWKRIKELESLLRIAKCPDSNCDGKGTICLGEYQHENGEIEIHLEQCQWCDKRADVLKAPQG